MIRTPVHFWSCVAIISGPMKHSRKPFPIKFKVGPFFFSFLVGPKFFLCCYSITEFSQSQNQWFLGTPPNYLISSLQNYLGPLITNKVIKQTYQPIYHMVYINSFSCPSGLLLVQTDMGLSLPSTQTPLPFFSQTSFWTVPFKCFLQTTFPSFFSLPPLHI